MVTAKKMELEAQQLVEMSITFSELKKEEETVKKEVSELEGRKASLDVGIYHKLWKAAKAKQDVLGRKILAERSKMEKLMSSLDSALTGLASSLQKGA